MVIVMTTLRVMLHPINKNKEGKRAIVLRVGDIGSKFYVSFGINDKLFDSDFDPIVYIKPSARITSYKQKNAHITRVLADAQDLLFEWNKKRLPFSIDRFKEQLQQKKLEDFVFPFFEKLIDQFSLNRKPGNASIYNTVKNSLFKFKKSKQLKFSDITLNFLQNYESFLCEEGLTGNGMSLYMRTLRATCNSAIRLKVADVRLYPFHNLQNPNGYKLSELETATIKRAIKLTDIHAIENIETKPYSMKHDAKQYFLFSFYTRGMNFKDMALLKPENCQNGRISYTRAKTRNRKMFTMEIMAPVQSIIDYFSLHPFKANYLLPILDDKRHPTEKQKMTRVQSLLKKVNRDLKLIGADAKINIPLTTYVARHSWATIMKNTGIPTAVISEGMGHPDEKTTQIYLENFENSVLDDANRKLLE
jgi:site-specific recombinase XerD